MKAPDKIYLHGYSFSDEPVKSWEREPKVKRGVTGFKPQYAEYIRKDALVEWAKAYKEEADATRCSRTDNPSHGQSVAMKDLIIYINSL